MFNDDSSDSGLYSAGAAPHPQKQPARPVPVAPAPDPGTAVVQSVELLAGDPSPLLSADPNQSKLPFGWAVVGVCAAAVIWAASLEGGKK